MSSSFAKRMILVALTAVASPIAALSFEVDTHKEITAFAISRSVLSESSNREVLGQLGLFRKESSFGVPAIYFDFIDEVAEKRAAQVFENLKIQDRRPRALVPLSESFVLEPFSILGWIMRGAIREDDNTFETGVPQDDPWGNLERPLRHFYDPRFDRGLTKAGLPIGERANDWALDPIVVKNHFGLGRVKEAMFRATTLMWQDNAGEFQSLVVPDGEQELTRKRYWATAFRALGDVLHLLQDMGQPQHTRNDAHSGRYCVLGACPFGHASVFEKYVDARAQSEDGQLRAFRTYLIQGEDGIWRIDSM